jgi:hypothetical protein
MLTTAPGKTKIGPLDHDRKVSLRAFEFAKTEEGDYYELSRAYITVGEVG